MELEDAQVSEWVRGRVSFVRDPAGTEALQAPSYLEKRIRAGEIAFEDCDGMAMYTAALLKAVGHTPIHFVIVGPADGDYNHVFVKCHHFLDPSRPAGAPLDLGGRHILFEV